MKAYDHLSNVPELPDKIATKKVRPKQTAWVDEDNCTGCQACVPFCPVDCIEIKEASIAIDHKICIDCDLCIYVCPIEVLSSDEKQL